MTNLTEIKKKTFFEKKTPSEEPSLCEIRLGKQGCKLFEDLIKFSRLPTARLLKWALLIEKIEEPRRLKEALVRKNKINLYRSKNGLPPIKNEKLITGSHVRSTNISKWRLALKGETAECVKIDTGLEFVVGICNFKSKEDNKKLILVFERVSETLSVCVAVQNMITADRIMCLVLQTEKAAVEKMLGVYNQTESPNYKKALNALDSIKILGLLSDQEHPFHSEFSDILYWLNTGGMAEVKCGDNEYKFSWSKWSPKILGTKLQGGYDFKSPESLKSFASKFNKASLAEAKLDQEKAKIAQTKAETAHAKGKHQPGFTVEIPNIWNDKPQYPSICVFRFTDID